MKSYRKELRFNLPTRRAIVNITPDVEQAIYESGIKEGLVLVNAMNITASVFINDDESGLHSDYEKWLEGIAPEKPYSRYAHNGFEDNADAHLKRTIMGRETVVAITNGKLDFGTWEQIFYYEFDGKRTLVLETPITIDEIEKQVKERLNLKHIRFVGQRNKVVKTISLCAGAWGDVILYEQLNREEVDLVICGEICEYSICEYVRDSAQLGVDMALFVLGHMGSERSGMEYVCEYINESIDGVEAVYLESGEVYN